MKKVFHFVNTNILSGLETMVINISTLVDGYEHYYVSPNGPINAFLRDRGVKHIPIKRLDPFSVRRVIRQDQPDIVQGHDVIASVCLAMDAHYCKKHHIQMVSELHNNDARMVKPGLRANIYLWAAHAFPNIIVVSQSVIDEYVYSNAIKDKATVIKNVVAPGPIEAELKKAPVSKKWDAMFLGRLTEQKQPLKFVDIIKHMQSKHRVSAVMLGQGELGAAVQKKVVEENLSRLIKLAGFQSAPYSYLTQAKVLLIPSLYEGFGLVALEALLLGVPVIASPVGGLVDIASEKCGGFAKTTAEFADKALKVVDSPDYQEISQAARKRGQEINDIDKFAASFKQIYG